ncbi:MAG: sensor histidine kinase [Epulopiscium sp.]|nr:sensor histidine kinase [Candidatus Epulonipiscium sp.]
MKELSLHILDIVENSIRAEATSINVKIEEDIHNNRFIFLVEDNGKGMDEEFVKVVKNPFKTTRTTRKVGLGISLLEEACKRCNGNLEIISSKGGGTKIRAVMMYNHIDRAPLGDITSTITNLIMSNPDVEFVYEHKYNDELFLIDTKEIKNILDGVPISDISIILWLKDYINQGLIEIRRRP